MCCGGLRRSVSKYLLIGVALVGGAIVLLLLGVLGYLVVLMVEGHVNG